LKIARNNNYKKNKHLTIAKNHSMKKFIKVIMLITNRKPITVEIETIDNLHEVQIYDILEGMFPAYIYVNSKVDEKIYQEGYDVEYKNGLHSVAIYRSNT